MLILGFVIWNIWKERNRRIFKNKAREPHLIINQILKQLKESVKSILRTKPTNPPLPQEIKILINLDLQAINPQGVKKDLRTLNTWERSWQPPPQGFFKVNINGSSKGNPGEVGFGGAIRDLEGHIKYIFHGHLEKGNNNIVELLALDQCMEIPGEANLQNVIIEANSELVVKVSKKIQNGASLDKV